MEEGTELHRLIIRHPPQQTAQMAVRYQFEQPVGLGHEISCTCFPEMKERFAAIAHCLRMIHKFLQDQLKIGVDGGIPSEWMHQIESKFDRLARMHLSGYQREDHRLLHLVACSDRLVARMALTMIANPSGSAMWSLAIGGLCAQSKSRDLPWSISMITSLHGGRVETELHELFKLVSGDTIDSLDGVDREDHASALPRERHVESLFCVEER